ncbi:MAG: chemotaxis protein CheX [Myxococcales bacterium]|nr:chemotaxis protein CheX [Myxococcales bacterium]
MTNGTVSKDAAVAADMHREAEHEAHCDLRMEQGGSGDAGPAEKPTATADQAQFFGAYLVEQGVVSQQQVDEAVALGPGDTRSLEDVAVYLGLMTERQVRIVRAQQRRAKAPFGALALRAGFLSEEGLAEVNASQGSAHFRLGDALIRLGYATADGIEAAHTRFSRTGTGPASADPFAGEVTYETVREQFGKLLKRLARIEGSVKAGRRDGLEPPPGAHCVHISIDGSVPVRFGLCFEPALSLHLTATMLELDDDESDDPELIESGVAEFANMLAGRVQRALRPKERSCIKLPKPGTPKEPYVRCRTVTAAGLGILYVGVPDQGCS